MDRERMIIRLATKDDVPAIAALHSEDDLGGHGDTTAPEALDDYLGAFSEIEANPSVFLHVVDVGNEVVATFQLTLMRVMTGRGALHLDVEAVRTASRMQGQGIGKAMMEYAIDFARERGCKSVKLTSNLKRTDAHRFYERLGFEKTHAGFRLKL
jgi:GNAT superfamily N-acetyltransferase